MLDTPGEANLPLPSCLAEAMGGSLDPETTPGGGLTITLRLPTTDAAVVAAAPDQAPDPAALERVDQWERR